MANTFTKTKEEVKNVGTDVKNKAQEVGAQAMDKAKEVASGVSHVASDVAHNIGQRVEDATTSVGGGMKSLAGQVREHGPQGGTLGSATSAVADTLESGGKYLQVHGLQGVGEDLTALIRRNPIPAVLIGIGVGFLISRATSSRT
jgi:hypothetical protein